MLGSRNIQAQPLAVEHDCVIELTVLYVWCIHVELQAPVLFSISQLLSHESQSVVLLSSHCSTPSKSQSQQSSWKIHSLILPL